MRTARPWGRRVVPTLVGAAAAVLATSAAASANTPAVVSSHVSAAAQSRALSYWTPARMAAAKPLDIGRPASSAARRTIAGDTATGKPGLAGGFVPKHLAAAPDPAAGEVLSNTSGGVVAPADGAFPGPNQTWNWFQKYDRYPNSTVGKLFFSQNGGNFVCTATVTSGGGSQDVIWSAGHCISNGAGVFDSSATFCPDYNASGPNPHYGCWAATSLSTTTAWHNSGDWSRDYGVIYLSTTGGNTHGHVADATGAAGFSWNWGRDQHWMDFGYPSGSPYDGTKLVVTAAEHRYDISGGSGPAQNSIGSAQTPGFSGGPWFLNYTGSSAWINSDNSYYFTSGANGNEYGKEIQGPYFDTGACNNWKGWTGWTGTC